MRDESLLERLLVAVVRASWTRALLSMENGYPSVASVNTTLHYNTANIIEV